MLFLAESNRRNEKNEYISASTMNVAGLPLRRRRNKATNVFLFLSLNLQVNLNINKSVEIHAVHSPDCGTTRPCEAACGGRRTSDAGTAAAWLNRRRPQRNVCFRRKRRLGTSACL